MKVFSSNYTLIVNDEPVLGNLANKVLKLTKSGTNPPQSAGWRIEMRRGN